MDNIPHISLPIRFSGGSYVVCQQDTDTDAATCVGVIVSFRRGFRIEKPEFGIMDPTFETQPIDTADIAYACQLYEPRATVALDQWEDPDDPGKVNVRLLVTMPTSDELVEESEEIAP